MKKKNKRSEFSESYEVRFWIEEGDFWKQKSEIYFGKTKGDHELIVGKWRKDYKGKNVELIAVEYQ